MSLRMAKFECDVFADGKAASEVVEANPSCYDLILLDAQMGGGDCDGLPTLRRLKEIYERATSDGNIAPPPAIVILTGETNEEVHATFLEAGAARVIVKPAKLEVFQSLHALVQRGQDTLMAGWMKGRKEGGPPPSNPGGGGHVRRRSVSGSRGSSPVRRGSSTMSEW